MTKELIIFFIFFLAVFTQSVSGFGFALVAMVLLPSLIGIQQATPLVALMMATISVFLLIYYRGSLNLGAIWPIIVSSLVGIPIGILFLSRVDEQITKTALGVFIIAYAIYALIEAYTDLIHLPTLEHPIWTFMSGMFAGILGGAFNTSGPPVIIYGNCKRWNTAEFKSNLQGFFLVSSLVVVLGHAWNRNLTPVVWQYYLWSIPAMVIGIFSGTKLDNYLKPETFRRFVIVLLGFMGFRLIFF